MFLNFQKSVLPYMQFETPA
ncbi:MAG: hypothetical protein DK841_03965 [Candidatus Melainabacteria bacterium]|nr:MAG: hypothetical protein DK841_03965 [Candidatus Melainabacteria bacterium]